MASGKFTAQSNAVLDQWFGDQAPTGPGTWYLTLFTAAPNKNGGGTEASVTRVALTNDLTTWAAASNNRKTNAIEIEFAEASSPLGTIVSAALVNTPSGAYTQGVFGSLTRSVAISAGQKPVFEIGAIEIVET